MSLTLSVNLVESTVTQVRIMYCNPGSNHVASIPETKKKTWFTIHHPKITRFLNIEATKLKHLLRLTEKGRNHRPY